MRYKGTVTDRAEALGWESKQSSNERQMGKKALPKEWKMLPGSKQEGQMRHKECRKGVLPGLPGAICYHSPIQVSIVKCQHSLVKDAAGLPCTQEK